MQLADVQLESKQFGPVTEEPKSELELLAGALALARKEVIRRLKSPKLRAEISSTTLMRFTLDATKLVAHVDQSDERAAAAQATHALTIIRNQGLPLNRQLEMVEAMIAEVGPQRAEEMGLTAGLAMLMGEIHADAAEVVEQEPDDEENT